MYKLPKKSQSGQALLIILLIMAVSLTVGLSVVSRSVTDIELSQESEESARAFSAAEAGIEESLISGAGSGGTFTQTGATYQTTAAGFGAGTSFAFPGEYENGETQTLWLSSTGYAKVYDRTGLRVVWGQNTIDNPALEVLIYYKDGSDYKVGRFALDPISRSTTGSSCTDGSNCFCQPPGWPTGNNCPATVSNFTIAGETVDGKNFQYGATLDLSTFRNGTTKYLLFARLRILNSDNPQILGAIVAGTGLSSFSAQGTIISAVGQSGSATRKVEVRRLYPAPPAILDFSVFSGGSLVHQ